MGHTSSLPPLRLRHLQNLPPPPLRPRCLLLSITRPAVINLFPHAATVATDPFSFLFVVVVALAVVIRRAKVSYYELCLSVLFHRLPPVTFFCIRVAFCYISPTLDSAHSSVLVSVVLTSGFFSFFTCSIPVLPFILTLLIFCNVRSSFRAFSDCACSSALTDFSFFLKK